MFRWANWLVRAKLSTRIVSACAETLWNRKSALLATDQALLAATRVTPPAFSPNPIRSKSNPSASGSKPVIRLCLCLGHADIQIAASVINRPIGDAVSGRDGLGHVQPVAARHGFFAKPRAARIENHPVCPGQPAGFQNQGARLGKAGDRKIAAQPVGIGIGKPHRPARPRSGKLRAASRRSPAPHRHPDRHGRSALPRPDGSHRAPRTIRRAARSRRPWSAWRPCPE